MSMRSRKRRTQLSERQKKILKFIEHCYTDSGYPPTIREIGEAVHIASTSVVNYNLNKLEALGYIKREKKVSRGLRLLRTLEDRNFQEVGLRVVESDVNIMRVPLVGKIVASEPVALPGADFGTYYDEDDMVELPTRLLGRLSKDSEIFALRVNGESMIDSLVNHNDIVILKRQETANDGDMVAVWLSENHETTLKHIYREGSQVRLQPANSTMAPIYVDAHHVQIQGRVLAVLRQI